MLVAIWFVWAAASFKVKGKAAVQPARYVARCITRGEPSRLRSTMASADIATNGQRVRWLPGEDLRRELSERAADPALRYDLGNLAGQSMDEL